MALLAPLGPGLIAVAVGTCLALAISRSAGWLSVPMLGVAIGVALGAMRPIHPAAEPGLHFAATRLLRLGVVLLGLRLAAGDIAAIGGRSALVVAAVVGVTFLLTLRVGLRLGVTPTMSLLVATGFSICGVSAIAAIKDVIDAPEEEVGYAATLVTLCGTAAMVLLPPLSGVLGLSTEQFGMWVGASVQDVAQVVATSSVGGSDAERVAILVKLMRVVLLAPLVATIAVRATRNAAGAPSGDGTATGTPQRRRPIVPLFVVGFLAAVAVRSSGALSDTTLATIGDLERVVLAAAMVGVGSSISTPQLLKIGLRPLQLGLAAWLIVALAGAIGVAVARPA